VVDVHDEVVRHAGLIIPLRRIANRISVRYSLRSTPFVLPIRNVPAETFTLVLATTFAALPCQLFSFRCPCRHEIPTFNLQAAFARATAAAPASRNSIIPLRHSSTSGPSVFTFRPSATLMLHEISGLGRPSISIRQSRQFPATDRHGCQQ